MFCIGGASLLPLNGREIYPIHYKMFCIGGASLLPLNGRGIYSLAVVLALTERR